MQGQPGEALRLALVFLLVLVSIGKAGVHMDILAAISAFAMGIESMVARRINVSAVATTYVTGTVTCLVYRSMIKRMPADMGLIKIMPAEVGALSLSYQWL